MAKKKRFKGITHAVAYPPQGQVSILPVPCGTLLAPSNSRPCRCGGSNENCCWCGGSGMVAPRVFEHNAGTSSQKSFVPPKLKITADKSPARDENKSIVLCKSIDFMAIAAANRLKLRLLSGLHCNKKENVCKKSKQKATKLILQLIMKLYQYKNIKLKRIKQCKLPILHCLAK